MTSLPDTICSPQDLTALILEVREYAKWYEHESIKQQTGATQRSMPPVLSPFTATLLKDLSQNGVIAAVKLDQLIKSLETYKKTAPSITVTLAAPATEPVKKLLTAWCRKELSANILVSFEYNRTLLGGMVVRYGSHVHDWSFRRRLMNSSVSFSEVLGRV